METNKRVRNPKYRSRTKRLSAKRKHENRSGYRKENAFLLAKVIISTDERSKADTQLKGNSDVGDSNLSPLSRSRRKSDDVFKTDAALQAKCTVNIVKLNSAEEAKLLESVGSHFYDADAENGTQSDDSVDNLTNLKNLKRKAEGSDEESKNSSKPEAASKKKRKAKEEEKLADFLNRSSVDSNVSQADDSQALNISDLSIVSNNGPFKLPGARPLTKRKVGNQKQQGSGRIKQFICTYCLRSYVAEVTMRKHMRTHMMQAAASRFPDKAQIMQNANAMSMTSLTEVSNCPSYGQRGQLFRELLGEISCSNNFDAFSTPILEKMVGSIDTKKCLMPSALLKSLDGEMENILCDNDLFYRCMSFLKLSDYFDIDVQSQFFLEFCLALVSEIFKFISSTFRNNAVSRVVRSMPALDIEDKQVIYYIEGSIMRGYLRIAFRYKANSKWKEISSVLKNQVLCEQPSGDIDAEWTKQLDRGRLLYITVPCQRFFISLTQIVYQNESNNGSIDYDLIIKLVSNCDTSILWDNVIGDSLSEEMSVGLMNDVVSAFCKACGRGIARRRLNALREKPIISMPTRHAVASRKK
ncbi:Zinc finger and BTB domain-containing protein 6 [Frankliniella fusca]|uniref:Zinc finger and BTB domain-containing protein 6 n=1 Tax=Frankliniella fusca TaxID=407009 RepID=A0AAE1I497_9NEOP|nr:Zinc finger and BTB domain-containing protein 6 [Frankliniella fusca]